MMIRLSATATQVLAHSDPSVEWADVASLLSELADIRVPSNDGGAWFPVAIRSMPRVHDGKPNPDDMIVVELSTPPKQEASA